MASSTRVLDVLASPIELQQGDFIPQGEEASSPFV